MRKMKDSGIEWIGEIPTNWKVCRFKNVANLYTGNSIKDNEKDNYLDSYDAIPYISTKDITKDFCTIDYNNGLYTKREDCNFRKAPLNSTLMCIEGGSAGIKKAKTNQEVSFVNKLCCFNGIKINNDYLYYFLNSPNYEKKFKKSINGLIGGVSIQTLKNFNITLPDNFEQQRIANFLDKKCNEINSLTSDIQKQIETLQEYKNSVITEAVTKGLDPNVEMKDTETQYWKKIPYNWSVVDIKYLFEIVKRIAGKEGYDILSVTQKGIKIKDISTNEGQIAENYSNYQLVYPTDYVMNHMDLLTGWVDCSEYFGVTSPDYRVFRLRSKKNNLNYYKYIMQVCYTNKIFYSLGQGVSNLGRWRLQTSSFNNFKIPLPPIAEQNEIADFLDKKCNEIDSLIKEKTNQLETLEQYKKSLIYEYVTGKKEVLSNAI